MALSADVDQNEYRFSHGQAPRGRGCWAFENLETGEESWSAAHTLYSQAVRALSKGRWKVLP